MKLWDSLATCLILLSAVRASPRNRQSTSRRARTTERLRDFLPVQISVSLGSTRSERVTDGGGEAPAEEQKSDSMMEELHPDQFEDVVDFIKVTISRIRRSSSTSFSSTTTTTSSSDLNLRTRHRRERKEGVGRSRSSSGGAVGGTGRKGKGLRGRRGGGGRGCVLKQIQLNVSDLGLGYQTSEEMIFKYCAGPCRKSETNYDKILNNLTHNRKLFPENTPSQACCRPIKFDDAISFLDDNLIYHTMRKHSARKCGCV